MNLGIIAHNSKKVLIEDFCIAYKNILAKHEVYATGTTGRRIEEATSLHVHKFLAGSIGGACCCASANARCNDTGITGC